jgi:hypothetical protein
VALATGPVSAIVGMPVMLDMIAIDLIHDLPRPGVPAS